MAIYQFQIYFIPQPSIIQKLGHIPNQLQVDTESWADFIQNGDLDNKPQFEDALSIQWWLNLNIDLNVLLPTLKNFGDIQNWTTATDGLVSFGDSERNDISVCFDKSSNKVEDVSCRLDLRQIDKDFVHKTLILAKEFECLLMDKKGSLFQPTFKALFDAIQLSNSKRFVTDPSKFLDDLDNGIIKPE